MAHFAELDSNNVVLRVIVVNNKDTANADGLEIESIGVDFCERLLGGTWKQTSYNGNFRKNYAGIGYVYHEDIDAFTVPQPFPSWTLDDNAKWQPPIPRPDDYMIVNNANANVSVTFSEISQYDANTTATIKIQYTWDENTISWVRY